jgi:hypothetical protein
VAAIFRLRRGRHSTRLQRRAVCGEGEQPGDGAAGVVAECGVGVRQVVEEPLQIALDEVFAAFGRLYGDASAVADGVSDAAGEAPGFEAVDQLCDAAAGDGQASLQLGRCQPVGVVGEVVEGGVLGVGHAGAGTPLGDDLLGRKQQLVQKRDNVASHKCLAYRRERGTARRTILGDFP